MSTETEQTGEMSITSMAIHNTELVSKYLIELMVKIFNQYKEADVFSVVFRENLSTEGKPVFGHYVPEVQGIVIGLQRHLDSSFEACTENREATFRIDCFIWYNLILSMLHEIKHNLDHMNAGTEVLDFESSCSEAQEWAYEQCLVLGRLGIDLNVQDIELEPYLGDQYAQLKAEILTSDDDWAIRQAAMFAEGVIYDDGENKCVTLMEYLEETDDSDKPWIKHTEETDVDMNEICWIIHPESNSIFVDSRENIRGVMELEVLGTCKEGTPQELIKLYKGDLSQYAIEWPEEVAKVSGPSAPPESGISLEDIDNINIQPEGPTGPAAPVVHADEIITADGEVITPPVEANFPENPPADVAAGGMVVLDASVIQGVMQEVLYRLHKHMFSKCGFNPGHDQGFTMAGNVVEPVFIGDIPNVQDVVLSCDTVDVNGRKAPNMPLFGTDPQKTWADGMVKGTVLKNGNLPGYFLEINILGTPQKRAVLAQNCNKMKSEANGGGRTAWADKAYNGTCITVVKADGSTEPTTTLFTPPGSPDTTLTINPFKDFPVKKVINLR